MTIAFHWTQLRVSTEHAEEQKKLCVLIMEFNLKKLSVLFLGAVFCQNNFCNFCSLNISYRKE